MAWKRSNAYPRRAPDARGRHLDATPCTDQHTSRQPICLCVGPSQRDAHLGPIETRSICGVPELSESDDSNIMLAELGCGHACTPARCQPSLRS